MLKVKKAFVTSSVFFTFAVIMYTGALALGVTIKGDAKAAYGLLFGNIAVLFGFSLVIGFSKLILETKLSSAVKRVIHAFTVYAFYMVSILLLANPGKDARQVVLFVFIGTLLYVIVYVATVLIKKAVNKVKVM